jgi:hypothetical protein
MVMKAATSMIDLSAALNQALHRLPVVALVDGGGPLSRGFNGTPDAPAESPGGSDDEETELGADGGFSAAGAGCPGSGNPVEPGEGFTRSARAASSSAGVIPSLAGSAEPESPSSDTANPDRNGRCGGRGTVPRIVGPRPGDSHWLNPFRRGEHGKQGRSSATVFLIAPCRNSEAGRASLLGRMPRPQA